MRPNRHRVTRAGVFLGLLGAAIVPSPGLAADGDPRAALAVRIADLSDEASRLAAIEAARYAVTAIREEPTTDEKLALLGSRLERTQEYIADAGEAVRKARSNLSYDLLAALGRDLGVPWSEWTSYSTRAAIERALRLVAARLPADALRLAFEPGDPRAHLAVEVFGEKTTYLLGEAVPLTFRVTNIGAPYLEPADAKWLRRSPYAKKRPGTPAFNSGGDYRCTRPYRFKVLAIDAAGVPARDPGPLDGACGGFVGPRRLDPGEHYDLELELTDFCEIERPGTYRVRVYHDLGWEGDDPWSVFSTENRPPLTPHLAPIVETELTFVTPGEEEIDRYLTSLLGESVSREASWRKTSPKRRAIEPVRHPMYLPRLVELAAQGRWEAAAAIGQIRGLAAIEALLELDSGDGDVTREATSQLRKRLAVPEYRRTAASRRDASAFSARDDLRDAANARFWRALNDDDRDHVIDAARLFAVTGRARDMEKFTGEFSRMVRIHRFKREETARFPRPSQVGVSMLDAGLALITRGAEIRDDGYPRSENTPAPELLRIAQASRDETFRPSGWVGDAEFLCTHPFPFVRSKGIELAAGPLAGLPDANANRFVGLFVDALGATDLPTRVAAADALGEMGRHEAIEPLLATLRRPGDEWLLRAAYDAAAECGATLDRLTEACVEALPTPGLENEFFSHVVEAVSRDAGGYSSRPFERDTAVTLRRHWRTILADRGVRERLARGETLTPGVPPVTAEAFPEGYHFRFDGREWPPWQDLD